MNPNQFFGMLLVVVSLFGGFHAGLVEAQDHDFKVGDQVELYAGGSAYVVRTQVIGIDKSGNVHVRYKTPFTENGVSTVTMPAKKFWRVGDEPNPPPTNEFELGDKVEFYFRQTDQVGQGIVSAISTNGEYYTIRYKNRVGGTMPATAKAESIWKTGEEKKPLPAGFRPGSPNLNPAGNSAKSASMPQPKPFRTWTAASGNFSVKARYLSTKDESVELEKEDGTTITVELVKLSEADNEYVANVASSDLTRRKITASPEIPFSKNRLKLTGGKWDFKHDPSEVIDFSLPGNSVRTSQPIGFGAATRVRKNFWAPLAPGEVGFDGSERTLDYQFSQWTMAQDGQRCFLIANSTFEQSCLVQGMNFATGELELVEEIDGQGIGISTDGSKIAILQTSRVGTERGELIIKEVGEGGTVLQRHIVKAFMDESGYSPSAGFFMNDSVLVTIGSRFVAFDLDREAGYSTTPFPRGVMLRDATISPNRKQIALESTGGIFLFDVSRGKPVGAIEIEDFGLAKIAFSADGSKLIHCSQVQGGIRIYDLTTGVLTKEIVSHGEQVAKSIAWPHSRFLLLDNKTLFDLELGIVVWRFQLKGSFFEPLFHMGGNSFIFNDGNQELTPIQLPMDRIEAAVSAFSVDDATVLKEGSDFRIDLETTFDRQDEQKIHEHFQRQMELRGITYNENSRNVFFCSVESGTEQSALIEMSDNETTTVRYTPTTCKIELEVDGKLKWHRTQVNTFSGGTLVGEQGETPQQAVTRLCRPKVGTFSAVRFPARFILFPNGKDVLGESTISRDGVKDLD